MRGSAGTRPQRQINLLKMTLTRLRGFDPPNGYFRLAGIG